MHLNSVIYLSIASITTIKYLFNPFTFEITAATKGLLPQFLAFLQKRIQGAYNVTFSQLESCLVHSLFYDLGCFESN